MSQATPTTTGVVLSVDTTMEALQVAMWQGNAVLASYVDTPADGGPVATPHRKHSARIIPVIQQVLQQAGVPLQQVAALVAVTGPGSFTGIRTGITCVRTLAQVMGIPILAVNRFELMAWWAIQQGKARVGQLVVGVADARRGRVYTATLQVAASGHVETLIPPVCMAREALVIPPGAIVVGELPEAEKKALAAVLPAEVVIQTPCIVTSTVVQQAVAGLGQPLNDATHPWVVPWATVAPLYIQPPSITLPKPPRAPGL